MIPLGAYAHSRSHFGSRRPFGCPERLAMAPCLNSDKDAGVAFGAGAVKREREGASLLWCKQKAASITKQNAHTQLGAPCGDGYVTFVWPQCLKPFPLFLIFVHHHPAPGPPPLLVCPNAAMKRPAAYQPALKGTHSVPRDLQRPATGAPIW